MRRIRRRRFSRLKGYSSKNHHLNLILTVVLLGITGPIQIQADDGSRKEMRVKVQALEEERMGLEEELLRLREEIHRLQTAVEELNLRRAEIRSEVQRIHREYRVRLIEQEGQLRVADAVSRSDEIEGRLAKLAQDRREQRAEFGLMVDALEIERRRLGVERQKAVAASPRDESTMRNLIPRRFLEIELELLETKRRMAIEDLAIDRQSRVLGADRIQALIEIEQLQNRPEGVERVLKSMDNLALKGARQEMEEIFAELLFENQKRSLELRIEALDRPDQKWVNRDRLETLRRERSDLNQLLEGERQQFNLDRLRVKIRGQIRELEHRASDSDPTLALLFEEELDALKTSVRDLATAVLAMEESSEP